MKKIGMLTSGGDCQALNAAMRGVVKCLSNSTENAEIYGFYDGYRGLIYGDYRMLTHADFSGILTKGGTILGTSRTPFKSIRELDENGLDKVEAQLISGGKRGMDLIEVFNYLFVPKKWRKSYRRKQRMKRLKETLDSY